MVHKLFLMNYVLLLELGDPPPVLMFSCYAAFVFVWAFLGSVCNQKKRNKDSICLSCLCIVWLPYTDGILLVNFWILHLLKWSCLSNTVVSSLFLKWVWPIGIAGLRVALLNVLYSNYNPTRLQILFIYSLVFIQRIVCYTVRHISEFEFNICPLKLLDWV